MPNLVTCKKNVDIIREYQNYFDVEILTSCDLKNILKKIKVHKEIYIPVLEFHPEFVEKLQSFKLYPDVYSLDSVLITLNLLPKILNVDAKLVNLNNISYFVLRE